MPDMVSDAGLRKVLFSLNPVSVIFMGVDDVALEVGAGCQTIRLPKCSAAAGRIYSIDLPVGAVINPDVYPETADAAEFCSGVYKGNHGEIGNGGHLVLYSSGEEWYSISEEAMTWI